MKAAVVETQGRIIVREVSKPKFHADSILVRVEACAVCGSDLRIVYGKDSRAHFPMIIGHEMAGIVAQVGSRADGFEDGDMVTIAPGVPCGHCRMCLRGLRTCVSI